VRGQGVVGLLLWAYPPSFRRQFGRDWIQGIRDLRVHMGMSGPGYVLRVLLDLLSTAPRLRWERLMPAPRILLAAAFATLTMFALAVGSPTLTLAFVGLVGLLVVIGSGHSRPIAVGEQRVSDRWYLWLVAAVGLGLLGLLVLMFAFTEIGWLVWMLSWSAAVVTAGIGLVLGAMNLVARHRGQSVATLT
jgi:hypothetical protein